MRIGIVIIASGHPYYGRYAYNLALTIKAVENIPVCLLWAGRAKSHLTDDLLSIFDTVKEIEAEENCGCKLEAYKNSPYEKTLVLDADTLWLPKKKPSELFAELEGNKFTAIVEGSTEQPNARYFFWAKVEEMQEKYKIDKIYQWRTEVMYFEKCKEVSDMFKDAKKIFKNHGLKSAKKFENGVADEMAINISCSIHNIHPHKENWQPSYWPKMHSDQIPVPSDLYERYYLFSAGGNHHTKLSEAFYNRLVKAQAPKVGHVHIFALQQKYTFLPQRQKR